MSADERHQRVGETAVERFGVVSAEGPRPVGMSSPPCLVGHIGQCVFYYRSGQRWKNSAHTNATVLIVEKFDGPSGVLLLTPRFAVSFYPGPLHRTGELFRALSGSKFEKLRGVGR